MSRLLRWSVYSRRQRELVVGLALGSSATIGFSVWQAKHRPLHADSGVGTPDRPHEAFIARAQDRIIDSAGLRARRARESDPVAKRDEGSDGGSGEGSDEGWGPSWEGARDWVTACSDSVTGIDFTTIREKITDLILPGWMKAIPMYIDKLRNELSGAPWSLSWEIWEDAHDPEKHPEILWDARVRISRDLCEEEQRFRRDRRERTAKALAKYLDVAESEVHPDDVPVIALCGSGGGLRALVSGASAALCAQQSGLFDCVTYTSGVSGSCWLQTLFHSSIGQQDFDKVIAHLKERIGVHIAQPAAALKLLSQAPTNKYLLSGIIEKLRGVPDADFGVVDVYGLLLGARLLVPKGELNVSESDLKVSHQQSYIQGGRAPMPIYTAIRHEIPEEVPDYDGPTHRAWNNVRNYDWFQWFEWTPYEFFCEELECGIPTWAVGRRWNHGRTVWRDNGLALPELRVPLMMGVWGSAFCATLSHYYKEIQPLLQAAGLGALDELLTDKGDDMSRVHPIDPSVIPNFAVGLQGRLPDRCPPSTYTQQHFQLMDAGMSNNLSIYPLLRPGREVDVIIAFDASADIRTENWPKVVDGYVRQRGIKGWPMGTGWPSQTNGPEETKDQLHDAQSANAVRSDRVMEGGTALLPPPQPDLGHCNIWVGSAAEREADASSTRLHATDTAWHDLHSPDAGLTLIYLPFIANARVPGVDPATAEFMGTFNFVYTPEQIEQVVALARANYEEGAEQTRRVIRGVWERKRAIRERLEEQRRQWYTQEKLREAGRVMGDHFTAEH